MLNPLEVGVVEEEGEVEEKPVVGVAVGEGGGEQIPLLYLLTPASFPTIKCKLFKLPQSKLNTGSPTS